MDKELFDKAKKIQDKMLKLAERANALIYGLKYGCNVKAEITGGCHRKVNALIMDKDVIHVAMKSELKIIQKEMDALKVEFENL